jgi:ribA/ribD-fused uncharacterized protein
MIHEFRGEYAFLSNFWPVRISMGRAIYPTVEHAYQARKTMVFSERQMIQRAATPGEAKRIGQGVTLRPGWENIKFDVMLRLLRKKFRGDLADALWVTQPHALVEGNHWGDTVWGAILATSNAAEGALLAVGMPRWRADNGDTYYGRNKLGMLLMQVRDELLGE